MNVFNTESRTDNALKASFAGMTVQILKVVLGFAYRSLFLHYLTSEYLGINGLFSNVLQVLSLAEMGVTTAIVFRFYEPISRNDVQYVGRLMNFFRRIYLLIAVIILFIGLALMPFIKLLINDANEIPSEINIYIVFALFLGNTISSYLFTYKFSLLTADQRNYVVSVIDIITTFARYALQITTLVATRDYTLTLAIGLIATLLINYSFSIWVTKKYKDVFSVKEMLSREERKRIYADTRACMSHKVGNTVLNGTDNVVLSKMVSLAAVGLYSNYSLIVSNIQMVLNQILGNLTASVGNAYNTMKEEEYYRLYRNMLFSGLWVSSVIFVVCCISIDDLIFVWLGEKYVFNKVTSIVLSLQLYINLIRTVNGAFIGATGLFVKDKIRPWIEAALNLGISIILTYYFGIVGVFLGTIISMLLTSFWREPYLLYHYVFKRKITDYILLLISFVLVSGIQIGLIVILKQHLSVRMTWITVLLEMLIFFAAINLMDYMLFRRRDESKYFIDLLLKVPDKMLHRHHENTSVS